MKSAFRHLDLRYVSCQCIHLPTRWKSLYCSLLKSGPSDSGLSVKPLHTYSIGRTCSGSDSWVVFLVAAARSPRGISYQLGEVIVRRDANPCKASRHESQGHESISQCWQRIFSHKSPCTCMHNLLAVKFLHQISVKV